MRPLSMRLRLPSPFRLSSSSRRQAHNRRSCSIDHAELPPELWLEIISILPMATILALTFTCRSLRGLAQPFIFQRISFRLSPEKTYMERLSQRLFFIRSPSIAYHIEECSITIPRRTKGVNVTLERAIDTVFDAIVGFPNLVKLAFSGLDLTQKRLQDLTLLSMSIIELNSCVVYDSDEGSVPVKTLICNFNPSSVEPNAPLVQNLSPFLDRSYIQSIAAGPVSAECILTVLSNSSSPYSCLTSLTIPVDTMTFARTLRALSLCPQLCHLSLPFGNEPPARYLTSLPPALLPNLRSFDGPHQYAAILSSTSSFPFPGHSRPIHTITLRPFSNTTFLTLPAPLLRSVATLSALDLHSLDILAITILPSLLPLLCTATPALKHLAINAHPDFYARCVTLVDAARAISTYGLPAGLVSLRLGVQMRAVEVEKRGGVGAGPGMVWGSARRWCVNLEEVRMWFWTQPRPAWVVCSRVGEMGMTVRVEY
ncbi:hypothetical protein Hypma_013510 [Hypsizygus marmoreus]|uniref:F-box domain-containing protein n=1 Tax=Hypsizygus marmoreus TaxID=39966 RepID=A0A369JIM9_HYPMA|nr:hypothetical protein Hypma_013510 [Hypsizygus marmoreus]